MSSPETESSRSGVETVAKKKAKEAKEKVVRASSDEYNRSRPPIKPTGSSESLFQQAFFPNLCELLRDGEAAVRSLIKMEEKILQQQYQKKVPVYCTTPSEVMKQQQVDDDHDD